MDGNSSPRDFPYYKNLNQEQQCPNKGDNPRAKMFMAYKEEREREKKKREKTKEKKGKIDVILLWAFIKSSNCG